MVGINAVVPEATNSVWLSERWVVDCKHVGNGPEGAGLSGPLLVPRRDSGEGHLAMRRWRGYLSVSRQQHRQERDANRQGRALSLAGVAARLAQRISALAQLWPGASQLQAPPAVDAAADRVQDPLVGVLHAGHADIGAAGIERAAQAQVQMLRIGDGDLATAHCAACIER